MRALRTVCKDTQSRREEMARKIESKMTKIPPDVFLWAAGLSIAGSLAMKMAQRDEDAHFIGQWAPTLLVLGLYNKIAKQILRD
jgi:hypothetical protein